MSFNTPILLITFTRLDTVSKVFERIKEQKPTQLFIASDGPRMGRPDDIGKITTVRNYLIEQVDWDCELKTLFRDENLGCGAAPYQAINWFFEHVEQGIILEDDCLPYPDFFRFCEETLNFYKNDERVWEISGTSLQGGIKRGDGSYYFSHYGGIWGWATWARAWKHYDYTMSGFSQFIEEKKIEQILPDKEQIAYWTKTMSKATQLGSWWDYQWVFTFWKHGGLCIVPNVNLIKNIGFATQGGTHTFGEPHWYKALSKSTGLMGNIVHPSNIIVDTEADDFYFKHTTNPGSLLKRIYLRLKRMF
jgi:hypothetical protein